MNSLRFSILMILSSIVLLTSTVEAQTVEIDKAKAVISELLKGNATVLKTLDKDDSNYDKHTRYNWGTEKNIFTFDDRIEFRQKRELIVIRFSDLINYEIYSTIDQKDNTGVVVEDFLILLKGNLNGKKLAEAFLFIKNEMHIQIMETQYAPQLKLFESVAATYRELKIKPQISEEERKYIVQANSYNEEKNYHKAIELYTKAIEVNQTAYPAAYLNLALLSAQVGEYYPAVYYMKKYLLLVPDAPDARAAQDNIYIWEAKIGK